MHSTPKRVQSPTVDAGPGLRRLGVSTRGLTLLFILAVAFVIFSFGAFRNSAPTGSSTGLDAEAKAGGLRITVTGTTDRVEAGGVLQVDVSIENTGPSPVGIARWECGAPVSLEATLLTPSSPGRDLSDPIEVALRARVAHQEQTGAGPGVITRPQECATLDTDQTFGNEDPSRRRVARDRVVAGGTRRWCAIGNRARYPDSASGLSRD